jgi:hypothetical protein
MQAGLQLVQSHERGKAISHQSTEQAEIFQRPVGQLMRTEFPLQIGEAHGQPAPASVVPGAQARPGKGVLDRLSQIGGIGSDHEQRRQHGGQVAPM